MQRTFMWLNLYGCEAVRHKHKNSLKTPKMRFLPVFELMSDSLTTIKVEPHQCSSHQFFFASSHENQSKVPGYQGWDKILMITLISSQTLPTPNISAASVYLKTYNVSIFCLVTWIQPEILVCQQKLVVVWRWNQSVENILGYVFSRTILQIAKFKKIFEIVQENTLKCSKLTPFLGNKISEYYAWSYHYTTVCFVAFLDNVSILKSV